MTVLVDNIAKPPCRAEWGLSILIEADGKTILLDTGSSGLFAENAELLGIDLAAVDVGVLSHAHYDHADGMDAFFSRNDTARFLVRGCSRENCFGMDNGAPKYIGIRRGLMEEYRERICFTGGLYEISDGILLVPHRPADYSAIALRTPPAPGKRSSRTTSPTSRALSSIRRPGWLCSTAVPIPACRTSWRT